MLEPMPDVFVATGGVHSELVFQQIVGHTQTTIGTHNHTYEQHNVFNRPTIYVFGMREETGVPGFRRQPTQVREECNCHKGRPRPGIEPCEL